MLRLRGETLDDHSDEGFGPGADLVFSVLTILIVMLAALRLTALEVSGDTDLSFIHREKVEVARAVRTACAAPTSGEPFILGGTTEIQSPSCSLQVLDNPQFQTLVFNEDVLFPTAGRDLAPKGAQVLSLVRGALHDQGANITEIQILGHTDTEGDEFSNFQLGSARALAVYNVLTGRTDLSSSGLSPLTILISVTTYGYYDPVQRRNSPTFSQDALTAANATRTSRALNRRIELNVFFRKSALH